MPVYKGKLHLVEKIDSILNQTFSNFEFVIVNDASSDIQKKYTIL
jgi:glycosyltransferase involved in cell wall biosynthesis